MLATRPTSLSHNSVSIDSFIDPCQKVKKDNHHLGQLFWPASQVDIQRNVVGFVVEGHICTCIYIYHTYPCERGPMGSAPYIGPKLGDGPTFKVSVSHLDAKERPGKLPTLSSSFE